MKRFIINFFKFLAPLSLILFPLEVWLAKSGESASLESVHQIQIKNKRALFMRGVLSQDYNTYKSIGIKRTNPDILVLGSSRVMQFRDFMFNDNYSFYNAGGILQCAEDFVEFVDMIDQGIYEIPKIIIVGIDPWWLKKDGKPNQSWLTNDKLIDHAQEPSAHLRALKKILTNFVKYSQHREYRQNIGLNAKITGGGFRYDGSKAPEMEVANSFVRNPIFVDRENPPINERIKKAITNRFTISPPDTLRYMQFEKALLQLQKKCDLILYMPPFTDESFSLLEQSNRHEKWWQFYTTFVSNRLKIHFKYIIDVHSPEYYKLSDAYFFDGFHPSEVFVGYQLSHFVKINPELVEYISPKIDTIMNDFYNPLTLLKNGK